MARSKRIIAGAGVLALSSTVSWLVLVTVPGPPAAAEVAPVRPAAAVGFYPGPQRARLLDAAILTAGRQRAQAAAARARQAAALRVREHAAHLAHVAHERHLAQLAADARAAAAQQAASAADAPAPPQRTVVSAPVAGQYSFAGLEQLWVAAGGPAWAQAAAATVAECESGGNPRAYNPSGASGLWQILDLPFPGDAFDPMSNARMAVAKFAASGDTWAQWVCRP